MTDAPQEQQGAPKPPAWLIIAGEPRPLLDVNDERWIAQARRLDDPTVEGVVIYYTYS